MVLIVLLMLIVLRLLGKVELLRPPGISEDEAGRRKSLSCMPNDLRVDRFSVPQTRF